MGSADLIGLLGGHNSDNVLVVSRMGHPLVGEYGIADVPRLHGIDERPVRFFLCFVVCVGEELLPHLYFDAPTATENTNIMREVSAYVTQQFNRYVMGVESLDTFDQFYRQLKEMGIETVLENYQDAYDLMYQK